MDAFTAVICYVNTAVWVNILPTSFKNNQNCAAERISYCAATKREYPFSVYYLGRRMQEPDFLPVLLGGGNLIYKKTRPFGMDVFHPQTLQG